MKTVQIRITMFPMRDKSRRRVEIVEQVGGTADHLTLRLPTADADKLIAVVRAEIDTRVGPRCRTFRDE